MKNISQNIPNNDTILRINRIAKTFKTSKRSNRAQMLKTLAGEIKQTQNNAVRNWLVRFHSTLQTIGGAK